MANRSGLSKSTVGRICRALDRGLHRAETFKPSKDPLFVDNVRDVVGLYLNSPQRAVVLCVDSKSQVQTLGLTPPTLFAAFNLTDARSSAGSTADVGRWSSRSS